MIALNREARKWARFLGAPENVVVRARIFTEHVHEEGSGTARVFDSTGRQIWSRYAIPEPKTVTRAIALAAGWVDTAGRYLLGGEATA